MASVKCKMIGVRIFEPETAFGDGPSLILRHTVPFSTDFSELKKIIAPDSKKLMSCLLRTRPITLV